MLAALCAIATLAAPAGAAAKKPRPLTLRVESSPAQYVTGGNALIAVDVPAGTKAKEVRVRRNGVDVTASFAPRSGSPQTLVGVVAGMRNGSNRIAALVRGQGQAPPATLDLFNSPITGPLLSGPHQSPFICRTQNNGLGAATDGNCSAPTAVSYLYRTTSNTFKPLPSPTSRPSDMVQTTTRTGQTVDYVVRLESGVINRSIYRWTVLASGGQTGNGWNGRLIYSFGGGCSTGYQQGDANQSVVLDNRQLSRGYAVVSSSLNVLNTACNDVLSAETALMVKERVIEGLGRPPAWTIGEGGSGGSIQVQMLAQNYPGLLDGLIPSASFPDNSQPNYPDCRLLESYFATGPGSALTDDQKRAVTGLAVPEGCVPLGAGADVVNASEGCLESVVPASIIYDPVTNPTGIRCTLWDSMVNVYGKDPSTGKARRTFDNVGVQYGLRALEDGDITLDEFLDLNEGVGGYDDDGVIVPQRAVADTQALAIAYRTGRIDQGAGGIPGVPVIDMRFYQDDEANVHQSINGFITRERWRDAYGGANQIMFRGPGGGSNPLQNAALDTMGQWLDDIEADTSSLSLPEKVVANKPADAVDACFAAGGVRINEPQEPGTGTTCGALYPTYSLPRNVAGLPLDSLVAKCSLKPVNPADYGSPSGPQIARLNAIFPGGVCDYSQPGVGQQPVTGTWQEFGPARTVVPLKRGLKLGAKRIRTKQGRRITLSARMSPCPETTWQRVRFERRKGKRWVGIGASTAEGKCTATLQTKKPGSFRATSAASTGYAAAKSKPRRPRR